MGVQILFKGRNTGGTAIRSEDLGGHTPHGKGPGRVSDTGGETADGTDPTEDNRRDVEINPDGVGK